MNVRAYGKEVSGFNSLVAAYEPSEFDSPLRSTVPLLEYWRDWNGTLNCLIERLELECCNDSTIEFEYAVPPVRGTGKPSYTDLAITTTKEAIAIEGKFREPPYETCKQWLGENPSTNRREVLGGWLDLIGERTRRTISPSEVLKLPYQLIHRTASACSISADRQIVVYQVFDPTKRSYYSGILRDLALCVGGDISLVLHVSRFDPYSHYQDLIERFGAGERRLSRWVIEALCSGPIGRFYEKGFERIT